MKIGRNDLCPCGSGEKYKKCCILSNKDFAIDSFENYLRTHNSLELLKIISLIQLLPINQSKLIRLETIQDLICSNLKKGGKLINYNSVKSLINNDYPDDYREDPSESCGTENIMFFNGNNIVFPGIAKDSAPINQLLLNAIFAWENDLSESVKSIIYDGTLFMLNIHDSIAKQIGLKRYLFEDDWKGKIYFPDSDFVDIQKDLFEFTQDDINDIYKRLNIKVDIIQYFLTTTDELFKSREEETILIKKPFLKFGTSYYLALPSAQMYSLNLFIRKQIELENQTDILNTCYEKIVLNESQKYINVMWDSVHFDVELQDYESFWKIDTNKYAYMRFMAEYHDDNLEKRADATIASAKKLIGKDELEFLSVTIFADYKIDEISFYPIEHLKETKYHIALSFFDLERIYNHWKPDGLTLWKYAKAEERANKANLLMAPMFSILTYFNWYKRNHESFFPTDDAIPHMVSFDYSIQAKLIAESAQKSDKHFVMQVENEIGDNSEVRVRYLPVFKTKDYAPIYTSEEIFGRKVRKLLEAYPFPIWFSYDENVGAVGNDFIESIIYWLNEFSEKLNPCLKNLGNLPIEIVLSFDERIKSFLSSGIEIDKRAKINVNYEIDTYLRKVKLEIPIEIFSALHRDDNYGEQILMDIILKAFSKLQYNYKLRDISDEEIQRLIASEMPLNRKKMLLTSHQANDFKRFDRYIPNYRYIQDADVAIVLESQLDWMNLTYEVPEKINDVNKIPFLDSLIDILTSKLKQFINNYNAKELLVDLMLRHEAIIQSSSTWDLDLPARIKCFEKYQDVIKEYHDDYANVVKASHSLRSLIEYVVAESPEGYKNVNTDDVDFLLAIISEIIFYGTIRDSIQIGIDNPEMGLLPSGRLGMNHDFHDNILTDYRDSIVLDEIQGINENFDSHFATDEEDFGIDVEKEEYYKKVTSIFEDELGIDFYQIQMVAEFMVNHCYSNESSWYSCTESELIDLIMSNSSLSKKEILAFISFTDLNSRGKIGNVPKDYHPKEICIWRFNRKLSYIRRPIIRLKQGDSEVLFWSARHLIMASDNLKAIFYNGTLKVEEAKFPKIDALVKERLNIKSKEFRTKVYDWLATTSLNVIPYEIKIRPSTFPNATRDYGDIDILVIDNNKKTVYLIECKNTKQAKVLYDFSSDAKNYIEKQLPRHISRGEFIKNNLQGLSEKLKLNLNGFSVCPIVVSSYQLPVKFLYDLKIPVYSFQEIKRKAFFN